MDHKLVELGKYLSCLLSCESLVVVPLVVVPAKLGPVLLYNFLNAHKTTYRRVFIDVS